MYQEVEPKSKKKRKTFRESDFKKKLKIKKGVKDASKKKSRKKEGSRRQKNESVEVVGKIKYLSCEILKILHDN